MTRQLNKKDLDLRTWVFRCCLSPGLYGRPYVSPPNTYTLDRCLTLPGGDADVESSVIVRIDGGGPVNPVPGPMRRQVRPGLCRPSSLGGQGGGGLGGGLMANARRRGGFVPPSFSYSPTVGILQREITSYFPWPERGISPKGRAGISLPFSRGQLYWAL